MSKKKKKSVHVIIKSLNSDGDVIAHPPELVLRQDETLTLTDMGGVHKIEIQVAEIV